MRMFVKKFPAPTSFEIGKKNMFFSTARTSGQMKAPLHPAATQS